VSAQGTDLFHITGYSLHQIFCAGTSVPLRPLLRISVGGYDWAVRFFPTEATAARWRFSSSS
jgi:hypothetical protein